MTTTEYLEWYRFHCSIFPGVKSWINRRGLEGSNIVAFWQQHLSNVGLDEAKDASTRLYELEAQPKSYERHPAEIKRLCRKSSNQSIRLVSGPRWDGAVTCLRCLDEGLVTVFYLRESRTFDRTTIIRDVLDNSGDESQLRTCCVRCECGCGDRFQAHPPWRDFMFKSEGNSSWRRETEWWQKQLGERPKMIGANSTSSFAELSTAGMEAF